MAEKIRQPHVLEAPEEETPETEGEQRQKAKPTSAAPRPELPPIGRTVVNLQQLGRQIT